MQYLVSKKIPGYLPSRRVPFEAAFSSISENCWHMVQFRLAYSYRHRFFEGEDGSEEDPSGLVAAVTRALSLSVGFQLGGDTIYSRCGKGIDNVPGVEDYIDRSIDNRAFKA